MVLADDIVLAQDYVAGTGGHKWNKPELQAAAAAMAWFIRELPGSPILFRALVNLVTTATADPTTGLDKATALLQAQRGLHGGDEGGEEDAPLSSTQRPNGNGLSWADISASQIPSAQGSTSGTSSGTSSFDGGGPSGSDPKGKVSDLGSINDPSLAAPVQLPHGPHNGALDDVGRGGEVVDVIVNVPGVAQVGGVDGGAVDRNGTAASQRDSFQWRPRVCNQVWKGKTCKNRSSGCRYAHPTPCSRDSCVPNPTSGCRAFHPRVRGNGKGSVCKGGTAPKGNPRGPSNKPPSRGNRPIHNKSSNSGSNNNNRSSHLQLIERVAAVERKMGETSQGKRRQGISYRDVVARGSPASSFGSSSSTAPRAGLSSGGDFAPVQPDPAMLSTVVAAVMAVLAGRGQHF